MEIYVDSSSPKEILEAREFGFLAGVTTNPSLIAAAGPDKQKTLASILDASPGSVFVQAVGWHEVEPLVKQARWLHAYSERIIVKLPMSPAGVRALQALKATDPTIRIAVTAIASVSQAVISAKAGADIVALFNGPLDLTSDTPVEIVAPVQKAFANYNLPTKILSCGRFPRHFAQFAADGTDICTLKLEFMKLLFDHPYTEKRMTGFLGDWQKTFGDQTWPTL
jgi:transaldolase